MVEANNAQVEERIYVCNRFTGGTSLIDKHMQINQ